VYYNTYYFYYDLDKLYVTTKFIRDKENPINFTIGPNDILFVFSGYNNLTVDFPNTIIPMLYFIVYDYIINFNTIFKYSINDLGINKINFFVIGRYLFEDKFSSINNSFGYLGYKIFNVLLNN
jgi:hypothetical protein